MDIVSRPIGRTGAAARSWKRALTTTLIAILVLSAVAYLSVSAVAADRLSHPERRPVTGTPADYGLVYEKVSFTSTVDKIPLEGWYIDSPGSKVIVMLHGRNGVRNDRDGVALEIAQAFARRNYDVFMFDFRAHGESGGERYSMGEWEVRDVAGALEYLKSRGVTEVGTIGFSLGAGTELNAAAELPAMRVLVSDSAFADVNWLFRENFASVSGLPDFFLPGITAMAQVFYGVDMPNNQPRRQVARLGNRPLLLIHGTADSLVGLNHAYALQQAAAGNSNLQVWIVPGAEHTSAYQQNPALYLDRVIGFFDENLK